MKKPFHLIITLSMIAVGMTWANTNHAFGQIPAIKDVSGVKANNAIIGKASRQSPLVVGSAADAAKYFSKENMVKLGKNVDFEKQVLMIFAWSGSGQDRLNYSVMESFPEQIAFKFSPGRTKDLRPHYYCFAVRSNVKWNGKPVGTLSTDSKPKEYVRVEVMGKLNSNVFAIGAETTGIQITADGITWELEFGKNEKLRKRAKTLDGKVVILNGRLRLKKGVEIKSRWIVTVNDLQEAANPSAGKKKLLIKPKFRN